MLEQILKDVEKEFQMGGLSDGLYADYAKEVATRFARSIVEQSVPERDPVKPSCWQVAQEDFRSQTLSNADNLLK
jgi:hypothetical protein